MNEENKEKNVDECVWRKKMSVDEGNECR